MEYPAGTEIICPTCKRVLFRLTRDLRTGEILRSVDVEQVDAPEHGFGVSVACPEHGIVDRYILSVRLPDGAVRVGI